MEVILISVLATYAITYILTELDGPFGILYRLRNTKYFGVLLCFYCTSVWTAGLVAILSSESIFQWLLYTFGFSGGAMIMYKIGEKLDG